MAFNPLALLQDRQCAPIYDALDAGRPSAALKHCDELLAKQPALHLASALKALALVRTGRPAEANAILDALLKEQGITGSSSLISALAFALSALGRKRDEADLLDAASRAHPSSLDLGKRACVTMVQAQQWQRLQQTALRLSKAAASSKDKDKDAVSDLTFWWSMQAYSLMAGDASVPGYQLALPLAQRMIAKQLESKPLGKNSDEVVYLYAHILQRQGAAGRAEALKLLSENETGRMLRKRSATLAALRREMLEQQNEWKTVYVEGLHALQDGDRNWATVEETVGAALKVTQQETAGTLRDLEEYFSANHGDRTLHLAALYTIKQAIDMDSSGGMQLKDARLVVRVKAYFDRFSTKGCTYEDLEPYAFLLNGDDKAALSRHLETASKAPDGPFASLDALYRCMNAVKLHRAIENSAACTAETEAKHASQYLQLYLSALPLGEDLPKTEMQPADDFALMTVQALLHASALSRASGQHLWQTYLSHAVAILKAGLHHSPKGYRLRILLIRVLLQFGAVDAARSQYDEIGIKGIQNETLGWILSSRFASLRFLLQSGSHQERDFEASMRRMTSVWSEGRSQVPAMVAKAFEHGTFSRVSEIVDFGVRLESSIAQRLHAIDTYRLRATGVTLRGDIQRLEAELKEATEAQRRMPSSDQRDRRVLFNLLPGDLSGGIAALLASPTAKEPDEDYVKAMLDVCAAAAGAEGHDVLIPSVAEVASLSAAEKQLHVLGRALLEADGNKRSEGVSQALSQLSAIVSEEAGKSGELPGVFLHAAAVALEAALLVQKRTTAADNASAGAAAADSLLRDLAKAVDVVRQQHSASSQQNAAASSGNEAALAYAWPAALDALAHGCQSKSGPDLVQASAAVLDTGIVHALDALDARIATTARQTTTAAAPVAAPSA